MKHIKTMMALGIIGADKLSRVDLLKNDSIMREGFCVNVTNAENVSRFLVIGPKNYIVLFFNT